MSRPSAPSYLKGLSSEDRAYVDFLLRPLAEKCKELGVKPQSFNEAAIACGYHSFEDYRMIRHRQWLLLQIPAAIEKVQQEQREARTGQQTLF
jgi:hypothetical protein